MFGVKSNFINVNIKTIEEVCEDKKIEQSVKDELIKKQNELQNKDLEKKINLLSLTVDIDEQTQYI
jgi:hypothetical protein